MPFGIASCALCWYPDERESLWALWIDDSFSKFDKLMSGNNWHTDVTVYSQRLRLTLVNLAAKHGVLAVGSIKKRLKLGQPYWASAESWTIFENLITQAIAEARAELRANQ